MVSGAFRYLRGIAPVFSLPTRRRGALAVGFYTPAVSGVSVAEEFFALDGDPAVDLTPVQNDDVLSGALDRLDALVVPDGDAEEIEKNLPPIAGFLDAFAARGGALARGGEDRAVPAVDAVEEPRGEHEAAVRRGGAGAEAGGIRFQAHGRRAFPSGAPRRARGSKSCRARRA